MDSKYDEILERARRFCAYRERASSEVMNRLREWKAGNEIADRILASLNADGFVDDERFAMSYVRGKFGIKKWGRVKISAGLKKHRIAENIISKALSTIDNEQYEEALKAIIGKKRAAIPEPDSFAAKLKILHHALQKGYERALIHKFL